MTTPIFFTGWIYAFAAGLFGATFFMLVDLQRTIPVSSSLELRDMWTFKMIGLRCAVGIGAATILYFFFQTNLLGDGFWPKIASMGFDPVKHTVDDGFFKDIEFRLPDKNTSLLVVWSFLAGYSQTLVPNILTRTAGEAQKEES